MTNAPTLQKRPPAEPAPIWTKGTEDLLKSRPGAIKAALTGGIASGKSTVLELFLAFGAKYIDFDQLAKEALQPQSPGLDQTLKLFGPDLLLPDESLNRPKLAKIVFKDPEKRKALEDIIHPLTWQMMTEKLKNIPPCPLVIIDIPLLYEARLDSLFYPIILSFASPETQLKRLLNRNPSLSSREAKRILKSQWPISEKIRRANYIINNNGPINMTIRETSNLWSLLTEKTNELAHE